MSIDKIKTSYIYNAFINTIRRIKFYLESA